MPPKPPRSNEPTTKKTTGSSPKKKGINSRAKGARFELEVAKDLSQWSGLELKRTPLSGGWNKTGDITPKSPEDMVRWPFNFEMKNSEKWDMRMLFEEVAGILPKTIEDFWDQCVRDAQTSKRVPVLVFTRNLHDVFAMVKMSTFRAWVTPSIAEGPGPVLILKSRVVLRFSDLLKAPYADVMKAFVARLPPAEAG